MSSFTLPDHTEIDDQTLRAIAARHGLDASTIVRLPEAGIIDAIFRLGEPDDCVVMRVPRNHPNFIADGYREAVVVPAARAAGVRTPALLASDASLELLPVPYTVYEYVPGVSLESLDLALRKRLRSGANTADSSHVPTVGVPVTGKVAELGERRNRPGLQDLVRERPEEGWLSSLDARWLTRWLDRLEPAALAPVPARFVHGDTQATNLLVSTEATGLDHGHESDRSNRQRRSRLRYEAIIDWGSAAIGPVERSTSASKRGESVRGGDTDV